MTESHLNSDGSEPVIASILPHSRNGEQPEIDVLIVGGGPAGLACAIALQRLGICSLTVEKGCVVNSLANFPTYMRFFTSADGLEIGGVPMVSHEDRPGRTEAVKYYQRLVRHFSLDVRQYERVNRIRRQARMFAIETSRAEWLARNVILATGYCDNPVWLDIPGEQLPKVMHYYKEPHAYFDQHVLVIGGRNSAGAAALELHRAGAHVTLVHRRAGLGTSMKSWIRDDLDRLLRDGLIKTFFSSDVLEIDDQKVAIKTPIGCQYLRNDFVFALTGYSPNLSFLSDCGITINEETGRPALNPHSCETSVAGLYLAGVIVAGLQTQELNISHAREHASRIGKSLASKAKGMVA